MTYRWSPLLVIVLLTSANPAAAADADQSTTVYVGTYTRGWACPPPADKGAPCTSKGIYAVKWNPKDGSFGEAALAAESDNPSYLAVHPNGRFLYAVNEVGDFAGDKQHPKTGAVSAYAIEAGGTLKRINQLSSHGADPCHISLTAGGKQVLLANYSGGTVASYLVGPGGELQEGSWLLDAGPHGPHANQDAAHAHFILEGPTRGLVYAADLGLDRVLLYSLDRTGKLAPFQPRPFVAVPPGGGPRHLAIAPSKRFLYTNNELSSTISVFARQPGSGSLSEAPLQTISTVPASHQGHNDTAELQLSADGRFAYVSNRGHDSITTFAVDRRSGKLTSIDNVPSGGKSPRDFKLAPGGRFLLVAHQVTDNMVAFRVDPKTGKLSKTEHEMKLSRPVNFAFLPSASGARGRR